jgi:hypothetical protein
LKGKYKKFIYKSENTSLQNAVVSDETPHQGVIYIICYKYFKNKLYPYEPKVLIHNMISVMFEVFSAVEIQPMAFWVVI